MELTHEEVLMRKVLEDKIQKKFETRSARVGKVLGNIENISKNTFDYIVPVKGLKSYVENGNIMLSAGDSLQGGIYLHDNAITQIAAKLGIPSAYLKTLVRGSEEWQQKLGVEIVSEHCKNARRDKALLRTVVADNGVELRGFLSDSYKRIDSMLVYTAFLNAAHENGARLIDAHTTV